MRAVQRRESIVIHLLQEHPGYPEIDIQVSVWLVPCGAEQKQQGRPSECVAHLGVGPTLQEEVDGIQEAPEGSTVQHGAP
eukprot:scaffold1090_cov265-Pinguiococcus_pyrenoidosus.AAC.31